MHIVVISVVRGIGYGIFTFSDGRKWLPVADGFLWSKREQVLAACGRAKRCKARYTDLSSSLTAGETMCFLHTNTFQVT
jgi:hypothetical protein